MKKKKYRYLTRKELLQELGYEKTKNYERKPFSTALREKLIRELKENWVMYLILLAAFVLAYWVISPTGG